MPGEGTSHDVVGDDGCARSRQRRIVHRARPPGPLGPGGGLCAVYRVRVAPVTLEACVVVPVCVAEDVPPVMRAQASLTASFTLSQVL